MGEVVTTVPTIGFNVETVQYKNLRFQVWDLGGQTSIRPYWRCYYQNTNAVIYVVDSADQVRIRVRVRVRVSARDRARARSNPVIDVVDSADQVRVRVRRTSSTLPAASP